VFEQRYVLAIQRAAYIQLENTLTDATTAVRRLLDVRNVSTLDAHQQVICTVSAVAVR